MAMAMDFSTLGIAQQLGLLPTTSVLNALRQAIAPAVTPSGEVSDAGIRRGLERYWSPDMSLNVAPQAKQSVPSAPSVEEVSEPEAIKKYKEAGEMGTKAWNEFLMSNDALFRAYAMAKTPERRNAIRNMLRSDAQRMGIDPKRVDNQLFALEPEERKREPDTFDRMMQYMILLTMLRNL